MIEIYPVPVQFDPCHAPKRTGYNFLAWINGRCGCNLEVPALSHSIERLEKQLQLAHPLINMGHVPIGFHGTIEFDHKLGRS